MIRVVDSSGNIRTTPDQFVVSAVDLDIRDIDNSQDSILIYSNTTKTGNGSNYVPIVDSDGHLQVDVLSGGGGGTQYTEGDTDASITGTAILWEDASNTLRTISLSKPLPVQPGTGASWVVTNAGTFAVQAAQSGAWSVVANAGTDLNTSALALEAGGNLAGAATSLAVIDDWDESDRCRVNVISGQVGISAGAGSVATNTPRVTLASDDPGVTLLGTINSDTSALAGCVGGSEIQADIVGALPAGTNAIGKLAANDGVDIGDVDVTSLPSDVAAADGAAYGKGVLVQGDDGTDRRSVLVDTDGHLQVDVLSVPTVTVTGTITANAGTDLNTSALALESGGNLAGAATSLAVVDDWDESDRCKTNPIVGVAGVAAGAGSVDTATQRVTLASDDPGVALLGTIDSDTSALAGCVGGSEIQADIVGALPAGTNIIGKVMIVYNYGSNCGTLNDTSEVTLIAAPSSGVRISQLISIYQRDSVNVTLTVAKKRSGTNYFIWSGVLAPGEVWDCNDSYALETTDSIVAFLGGAVTTTQPDFNTTYNDEG